MRSSWLPPCVLVLSFLSASCSDDPVGPLQPRGLLRTIEVRQVGSMVFSPDSRDLALNRGTTVQAYNVSSGELVFSRRMLDCCSPCGCMYSPSSIEYSHDGHLLAAGPTDTLFVMNSETGMAQDSLNFGGLFSMHRNIAFSPDDKLIYISGQSPYVQVWEHQPARLVHQEEIPERYGSWVIALSPDGLTLATSGWVGHVGLWSTSDWHLSAELDTDSTFATDVVFDPTGRYIAVAGSYRSIYLWDAASHERKWVKSGLTFGSAVGVSFSPDGRYLVTNLTPTDLALIDVETGAVLDQWQTHNDNEVLDVKFSPDGRMIAASSHANLKIWDVQVRLAEGD